MTKRQAFAAIVLLLCPLPAAGQVMKLNGTTSTTFSLGVGTNKLTLTNSAGTLTLDSGFSVTSGTVSFAGADIDGGTVDGVAIGGATASTGAFTTISASGQITSTLSTGTAPLAIASTTKVANLNVDQVDGMSLVAGSNGGVAYQSSSSQLDFSAAGASGQFLASAGSGAPTWAGLTDTYIYVGSASHIPTAVVLSGDATLTNAGVLTVGNDVITAVKVQQGTAGQVLMSDATPDTAWTTVSGDLTADGAGAFTIGSDTVTPEKFQQGTAGQVLMSNATPDTAWTTVGGDLTADGAGIFSITADAVTPSKVQQGTAGQVLMSSAAPDTAWTTVGGDLTADGAGAFTIANDAVTTAKISDANVTAAKLADAVADAVLTVSLSAAPEVANIISCTLQVKDAQGNDLSGVFLVHWNIDDSSFGAGTTAQTVTVSYSNGAEWDQLVEHKKAAAFTDSTGELVLGVAYTGVNTMYLMCAVAGNVYRVVLSFS